MVLSRLLSSHVRPASWCTPPAQSWVDSSSIKARSQSQIESQAQPLAGGLTSMCVTWSGVTYVIRMRCGVTLFIHQIVRTLSHEYTVKGDATLVFTVVSSSATVEHVARHEGGA